MNKNSIERNNIMNYLNNEPKLQVLNGGKVYLFLPLRKTKKWFIIGRIDYERKTFYTTNKNSKKHVFKKTNSLSIPIDLVFGSRNGFLYICSKLDGKEIWTSVRAVKKFGHILHFKAQGFEKQIFLSLNKWKTTKKEARVERNNLRKGAII
jgi:hypothetical protein